MRVVVLGPGGAGKNTFSRELASATAAALVEIDTIFWQAGLTPLSQEHWRTLQGETFEGEHWVADGDLGPYDSLDERLGLADTVVIRDTPLWRCAWRSLRRSRERIDYWKWLLTWRRRWRPRLLRSISAYPHLTVLLVRSQAAQRNALRRPALALKLSGLRLAHPGRNVARPVRRQRRKVVRRVEASHQNARSTPLAPLAGVEKVHLINH